MDITKLQDEYIVYWQTHDLNAVINNLNQLYSYFSEGNGDFSLIGAQTILSIPNLYYLYLQETGNSGDVTYSQLISWYSTYLQQFINDIQDTEKKLAALTAKSSLDILFESIGNALNFFTSPTFYIIVALIIIGIIILKLI